MNPIKNAPNTTEAENSNRSHDFNDFQQPHRSLLQQLRPAKKDLLTAAQTKIDNKTKPVGSLGRMETLAVQLCLIQEDLNPVIRRKSMFVFAGDHGVVEEGVSAYPSEVTGQMVKNFLEGGAAINVLCRHGGIDLRVVDMGVATEIKSHPLLMEKKIRKGTRNFARTPAMTTQEALRALEAGMEAFLAEYQRNPIDIVGLGDMGIGNTTTATAVICAACGVDPLDVTGRGTGIDDAALTHKAEVIQRALRLHDPDPKNGFDILQKVGGLEIAGIAGAALAAAAKKTVVVLDGVISTAGGLIAYLLHPHVRDYVISGHRSVEPAQQAALSFMKLSPLVDLNMRLGEGTGAALAIHLADAAAKIMQEMASFEDAGVSREMA
ncbi:MAG: nicotinate-nucleotide--dimethylbenzimidazole phosphoribosyltransferase [Deltaproteobacteria bacterium]|nr:nicotinate-nucleotide--dimethylbenzimidazole phosphoribosyltransferase [Deltaproteobacteria bacterium]MBW2040866.1 nicotinate-nucleotide--dimethylbenzimidazole phosphoribosyltransferase [Deltaproteobacteria bacterium]MBW2132058.1 nicotinate-nucleotide--dimethylbenzimidazole phosphoribosyltransferase [Deltaproteobacteria bacterium]